MDEITLNQWFLANKLLLENAYSDAEQPWQQSGFGLHTPRTASDWAQLRRPIAESITQSGTWLDIGCANGYLIECVLQWVAERVLTVDPYGLDFSEKLIALAQTRLPDLAKHFFVGNAYDWSPPQRFDVVSTALEYVPEDLRQPYLQRIMDEMLVPRGTLLVVEYASVRDPRPALTIDAEVRTLGFTVAGYRSGYLHGKEMTRIASVING